MLGGKEYLSPIDPRITQDYWEVWRKETVVLAIVLQRCAIHAEASPDVFCGAVQELQNCLVPMVEKGDLFSMEEEIWEGVRKDPMATTPPKRVPSLIPRAEEPTSTTAPDPPPTSKLEGAVSPEDLAWCWESGHCHPLGFSPRLGQPCSTTSGWHVQAGGYAHGNCDGPHCLVFTASDHLTYPGNWWGPLPPSGLECHHEVPAQHFLQEHLELPLKIEKLWTIINSSTSWKHLSQALIQVNTHSPNEVNLRSSEYPLSWWSEF